MGEIIEVNSFIPCAICHKRPATILCDMPVGRSKTLHMKLPNGITDHENSFKEFTITCDRAVCDKCSKEISTGVHFCKMCLSKLKDK